MYDTPICYRVRNHPNQREREALLDVWRDILPLLYMWAPVGDGDTLTDAITNACWFVGWCLYSYNILCFPYDVVPKFLWESILPSVLEGTRKACAALAVRINGFAGEVVVDTGDNLQCCPLEARDASAIPMATSVVVRSWLIPNLPQIYGKEQNKRNVNTLYTR